LRAWIGRLAILSKIAHKIELDYLKPYIFLIGLMNPGQVIESIMFEEIEIT